jgi:hypothetical protein
MQEYDLYFNPPATTTWRGSWDLWNSPEAFIGWPDDG